MASNESQLRRMLIRDRKDANDLRAEQVRAQLDPTIMLTELTILCEESKTCTIEDLERLKFRASIVTTMLKKCLPDLKSVEVVEKATKTSKLIIEMSPIDGSVITHSKAELDSPPNSD
jgi:hypothetical protein